MNETQEGTSQPRGTPPGLDADANATPPSIPVWGPTARGQGTAGSSAASPPAGWPEAEHGSVHDPDQRLTPPDLRIPADATGRASGRQRSSCLLGFLVGLSLVVGLVSLALTVFLLLSLLSVRQSALDGLDVAIDSLENLMTDGFHYEYQFNDSLPVAVEIPVQQEMVIPFQGNLPINTTVKVPIEAGALGTFVLDVPINTTVPVDVEVPVRISQTVSVSTSIPVSMTVPFDVTAEDPAIQGFVTGLQQWLLELRESLRLQILAPLLGSK